MPICDKSNKAYLLSYSKSPEYLDGMILFAVVAVPVVSTILLLLRPVDNRLANNNRAQFFLGIFSFVPYLVLYSLVDPIFPMAFEFFSQLLLIGLRDLIVPVAVIVLAIFILPPIKKRQGDILWFLSSYWSLIAIQKVVVHIQSPDLISIAWWPIVLCAMIPIINCFSQVLLRFPSRAYLSVGLFILISLIASIIPVFLVFNLWLPAGFFLAVVLVLGVLAQAIGAAKLAGRLQTAPALIIRLPSWWHRFRG